MARLYTSLVMLSTVSGRRLFPVQPVWIISAGEVVGSVWRSQWQSFVSHLGAVRELLGISLLVRAVPLRGLRACPCFRSLAVSFVQSAGLTLQYRENGSESRSRSRRLPAYFSFSLFKM